ncbi:GDSL-type esterase/lipase family protein [Candidatus Avelusimicrobium sp.]
MKKIILIFSVVVLIYFMVGNKKTTIKNVGNAGQAVVAFGDSLSYGYGAPKGQSYPDVLGQKISRPVVNMGRNGATAVSALPRLDEVLAENPYMVLIEYGGNDFMHAVPLNDTLTAIEKMVDGVQSAGAVAVIVDTGGYYGMNKYTKAYKKIAQEKGAVFVPGILNGVMGERGLMSDQIHPNAKGYAIVAEKVYKEIKGYL